LAHAATPGWRVSAKTMASCTDASLPADVVGDAKDTGEESEVPSAASASEPEGWNSDDEPPQDQLGDEKICSRDGGVMKTIRRVGRGLEVPGQYDNVRVQYRTLYCSATKDDDSTGGESGPSQPIAPSGPEVSLPVGGTVEAQPAAWSLTDVANCYPGHAWVQVEVPMGKDRLPLAVEFALRHMRVGEVAQVKAPAAYAAVASPLSGRRLRNRYGRIPPGPKVSRKHRFLPSAPRDLHRVAADAARVAKASQESSEGASCGGDAMQLECFHAEVELLGFDLIMILTEDMSVQKQVLQKGWGRRMPRRGDLVTFSYSRDDDQHAIIRRTLELGDLAGLPHKGLESVLLSMKDGERCIASLGCRLPPPRAQTEAPASPGAAIRVDVDGSADAFAGNTDASAGSCDGIAAVAAGVVSEAEVDGSGGDAAKSLSDSVANASVRGASEAGATPERVRDNVGDTTAGGPAALGTSAQATADGALEEGPVRLTVAMHRTRRRDAVPVLAFGAGYRGDTAEEGCPALRKLELRPGPHRGNTHVIDDGCHVLVALAPSPVAAVASEAAEVGVAGDRPSLSEKVAPGYILLSWIVGEGVVPGYMEAAVASMRFAESSHFCAPSKAVNRVLVGPEYEGQTPLRRTTLPEVEPLVDKLLAAECIGPNDKLEPAATEGCALEAPTASPECALPPECFTAGDVVRWADIAPAEVDGEVPFTLALVAVMEGPDVGAMDDEGRRNFFDRERSHGNALARLQRYPDATVAYSKALDVVRRTSVYKHLFPTERGYIEGAYSCDPSEKDDAVGWLEPQELEARRTSLIALHLNLALCAVKDNRLRDARKHATVALGADPNSAKALYRRGSTALAQGDYDEAQDDLLRAAELQPQDPAIRAELRELQVRMTRRRKTDNETLPNAFRPLARSGQQAEASPLRVPEDSTPLEAVAEKASKATNPSTASTMGDRLIAAALAARGKQQATEAAGDCGGEGKKEATIPSTVPTMGDRLVAAALTAQRPQKVEHAMAAHGEKERQVSATTLSLAPTA